MRRTEKIIIIGILLAFILIGIGYAAIQNITLNISSQAQAVTDQENFLVKFTGTPQLSDTTKATAAITNDTNATINVSGLTAKGEKVSVVYAIQNASTNLSADLAVSTVNSNIEYFILSSRLAKTSLTAGEITTVTVTVELIKTPLSAQNATIGIQLNATPVQPGEEGTSGATNDYSQTPETTLALIDRNNFGEYIDTGINLVGTESTADDWKILHRDENNTYAILSEYLPNNSIPVLAHLDSGEQGVYLDAIEQNYILDSQKWNGLIGNIPNANVIGTPTIELLLDSYNSKNNTNIEFTGNTIQLDPNLMDENLQILSQQPTEELDGYWVVSENSNYRNQTYVFEKTGRIIGYNWGQNAFVGNSFNNNYEIFVGAGEITNPPERFAIRPVVIFSNDTRCSIENGVWNIIVE